MEIESADKLLYLLNNLKNPDTPNAVLTGTIHDENGAVIRKTAVTLKSANANVYTSTTNQEGVYSLNVPSCVYSVEVKAPYFEIFTVSNYRIIPAYKGQQILDFGLKVATMINTITINNDED